jgi:peptide/nickel transport system permease protein
LRASMIDESTKDYVTTARAKGLAESIILRRHVLRNSLLPVVTLLGLYIGEMFAGAVVTETVFGWPGIGRLMFDSISRRDYPVIMGGFLLSATGVILGNLLADVIYGALDPRIRLGAMGAG